MTDRKNSFDSEKRVTLLMPNFEAGGAERVMIRLANGLAARGLPVDLLVLSERGPYKSEVDPRVRIVSLGVARAWRGLPGLVRYLRASRPRALLSSLFHMNFIAVMAHLLARVPLRLVIAEHNTQELVRSLVSPLRWQVYRRLLRWIYPRADAIVCVSDGVAQSLGRLLPARPVELRVIGNPVVTDEVIRMSHEPAEQAWLPSGEAPLVLAAGRLVEAKGFDVLLRAFAQVVAQMPARLLILGEGAQREHLQELVRQLGLTAQVHLPGFTPNPYAWMRKADVFVLSSRHEGLPGALIEAMACGCRVVATDCPHGPSDILEQGRWGALVPVGDPTALAQAIMVALQQENPPDVALRAQDYSLERSLAGYAEVLSVPLPQ